MRTEKTFRTTIRISGDLRKRIARYTRASRINFTHLVKVALETELLIAETVAAGGRVLLQMPDGSQKELVLR